MVRLPDGSRACGIGEFELIARIAPWLDAPEDRVRIAGGDDAAVLSPPGGDIVVTVDTMVEDRHFLRALSSFADVGWKLVAVNVSDLAAMGAQPLAAVVSLCRPDDVSADDVDALYRGMREAADRWSLALVGGDTVAGSVLTLTLTAVGTVPAGAGVTRSGARDGDAVVVAGRLGSAAAALALHRAGQPIPASLARAHRRPEALPAIGALLRRRGAGGMIDVSDGFGADLGHVCRRSGVGADVIGERLPVDTDVITASDRLERDPWDFVLGGGDDYALVAALPHVAASAAVGEITETHGLPAAVVGTITDGAHAQHRHEPRVDIDGQWRWVGELGHDHWRHT